MTTGYATVVMSLELMALEKICPLRGPLSNQPMLDLLFAIALPAIASALLFNVGASSGGTDVIALIVEKYTHIHNVAVALFLTDLFMVIAACFVFDLYTALYSFVGLTVKSLVIDAVLEKIKMCKAILIVCDDRKPICDFVMRKLMRGATYTPCFGAYTDKPHYIIYTTLTRREADQLQDFYPQAAPERLHVHAEHHRGVRQGLQPRIRRNVWYRSISSPVFWVRARQRSCADMLRI